MGYTNGWIESLIVKNTEIIRNMICYIIYIMLNYTQPVVMLVSHGQSGTSFNLVETMHYPKVEITK